MATRTRFRASRWELAEKVSVSSSGLAAEAIAAMVVSERRSVQSGWVILSSTAALLGEGVALEVECGGGGHAGAVVDAIDTADVVSSGVESKSPDTMRVSSFSDPPSTLTVISGVVGAPVRPPKTAS